MARVATAGTVTPTPGTDVTAGGKADNGAWTAGPVTELAYPKLTAAQGAVIHGASCRFAFAGSKSGSPVAVTSSVTLTAAVTKLQHGVAGVLVDGDTASDVYGNALTVHAVAKLAAGS